MISNQGVQMETIQPHNPPKFYTETTANSIDPHATEMVYKTRHHGMAEQDMADREMPDLGMELQD
jgi:hypothetical protein